VHWNNRKVDLSTGVPDMPESVEIQQVEKQTSAMPLVAGAVVIVILFAVALYFIVDLRSRVHLLEAGLERQTAETKVVEDKLHLTNKNIEAGMESLGSQVGMTQEELARRTADLKAQQERASAKLAAEQQATNKQVASVNSEVSGVKTELGGARTDIASTRTDLAATRAQLESAIGDLKVHSGLIAKNHDELEYLKHKGDRNYFEFKLNKKQRSPVSTVSLELKKTDPKKSRFTLNVYADDHTIEKKDRTLGEPLQFYTGRDRQLYEIVIFNVGKDGISGYLATPK
jgi:multidrug efflux pump subunit AcrA (membrane-fusion protein)